MFYQKERIDHNLNRLSEHMRCAAGNVGEIEYVKSGYKKGNTPPTEGWMPFTPDTRLQGKDSHFWIRASFKTPEVKPPDYLILSAKSGREGQASHTNPQSILYLNGEMIQGLDTNHYEAYLEPDTEYQMLDYFYTGDITDPLFRRYGIYKIDAAAEHLFYDMRVAYECCKVMKENSENFMKIMAVLNRAVDLLDFRDPVGENFNNGVLAAQKIVTEEIYSLCSTEGKPIVNCVGHTHIDIEWLWTRRQTREKIQRSFSTAAALMKKYPEYKFMLSQPELYRYLKEEAPEKYEELRQLVKEKRWEPEGAMYIEADCNLISGESFVRQILFGKRFFKEEFGIDCKILFLPDVFGYSAALPQILKKSGIRHFVTSKISWNDTNTIPLDMFMWQGIDGSEIFTNFITTQDYNGDGISRLTTYVGKLTPSQIKGTWNRFQQKDYCSRSLTLYGFGDGGGGPTKDMLERQRRLAKGFPEIPVTEMEPLLPYLDKTRKEFDENCKNNKNTPRWVGELYLEGHRGTYTSMARNKRFNRECEMLLSKAEGLSYTGMMDGSPYDSKGFKDNWTRVLHNQFHDIIPGSSIFEVYEQTDIDYYEIEKYCSDVINEKLKYIASDLNTSGGMLIYNSLLFPCSGPVKLNGKTAEVCEKIPSFGWNVMSDVLTESSVTVKDLSIENRYYSLRLDISGRIVSLFDKTAQREVFKEGQFGNEFQVFEDFPRYCDNWEIDSHYDRKMYVLDNDTEILPVTDGTRAGLKVTRKYAHSVICQTIWLYSESRRIDFENDIDWNENHQLMKIAFPFDIFATSATYEIQYGHVSRPTSRNTTWEQAKFEVYGHKWVDVSDNGYGVSLLNNCKYGYSAEGSTLRITAIKCGTYPNKKADQGKHIFTYSLLPHSGNFRNAGVIEEAYLLNQPLSALEVNRNKGKLPESYSLVKCDNNNIIIETVKKCETDDSMVVRMYESFNERTKAVISVPDGFKKVFLCDLMENEIKELQFNSNSVTIEASNFEILTLKFKR